MLSHENFFNSGNKVEPALTVNLQKYKDQIVPYEVNSNGANDSIDIKIAAKYHEYLTSKVSEMEKVHNMTEFVLDVADKSMDQYNRYDLFFIPTEYNVESFNAILFFQQSFYRYTSRQERCNSTQI